MRAYRSWSSAEVEVDPYAPPLGAREGRRERGGDALAWAWGPPGLAVVGPTWVAWAVCAAAPASLGMVGVVAGTWDDVDLSLRVAMAVGGAVVCALSFGLVAWPVLFAASWRERLTLWDGGVWVESGVQGGRARRLGDAAELRVEAVAAPNGLWDALATPCTLGARDAGRVAVVSRTGERLATVGVWSDRADAAQIAGEVEAARAVAASSVGAWGDGRAPFPPLGWTVPRVKAAVRRAWAARRAAPGPVLFDLAVALGVGALAASPAAWDALASAYPLLWSGALSAAWVRLGDPREVAGLRRAPSGGEDVRIRTIHGPFALALAVLGLVGGGVTAATLAAWVEPAWAWALGLLPSWVVLAAVYRRADRAAQAPEEPRSASSVGVAWVVLLASLTWVHERWAFEAISGARDLGPMATALVAPVSALLVWPGRALLTVRDPWDEGPRWSFLGVLVALTLAAATGWLS